MSASVLSTGAAPPPLTEQELSGMKVWQLEKLLRDKGLTRKGKKDEKIRRYLTAQANGFQSKPVTTASERKAKSRKRIAKYRKMLSQQRRQEINAKDAKRMAQARAIKRNSQSSFDGTMVEKEPGTDYLFDPHEESPETAVKLLTQKRITGAKRVSHGKEPLHTLDNCIGESDPRGEVGCERLSNVSALRLDAGLDSSLHLSNKQPGRDSSSSSSNNPVEGSRTEKPGTNGDSNTSSAKGVFINTKGREDLPIYSDSDSEIISRRFYTGKRLTIPGAESDSTSRDMRSLATSSATYDRRDADNFDSDVSCTSMPRKIGKDYAQKSGTSGEAPSCITVSRWGSVDISEDEDSRVSFGSESQGSLYGYEDDGFVCRG